MIDGAKSAIDCNRVGHSWVIQRTIGDRTPFAYCRRRDCEAVIHPWESAWPDAGLPMPDRAGTAPGAAPGAPGQEGTVPGLPEDCEASPETLAQQMLGPNILARLRQAGLVVRYGWQDEPSGNRDRVLLAEFSVWLREQGHKSVFGGRSDGEIARLIDRFLADGHRTK